MRKPLVNSYQREMWGFAQEAAKHSKDPNTKVGCVAAKNKRLMGSGRNGFPSGIPDIPELMNNRDFKLELTTHAEANLVAIWGNQLHGADVFVTLAPCNDCAQLLITSGVSAVYTEEIKDKNSIWYHRWQVALKMFNIAGIGCYVVEGDVFKNAYSPFVSLKDALDALQTAKKGEVKVDIPEFDYKGQEMAIQIMKNQIASLERRVASLELSGTRFGPSIPPFGPSTPIYYLTQPYATSDEVKLGDIPQNS